MTRKFLEIALTPSVQKAQIQNRSRHIWQKMDLHDEPTDNLGPGEMRFISVRDSFYLSTVSETGWPYVQHRGGPAGFLKVINPNTLAFADYSGNRQYLTTGNLEASGKAALIMVDYAHRRRLKIYAEVEILQVEDNPQLTAEVAPNESIHYERIILLHLLAFDWNCPQYITPRFNEEEVMVMIAPLHQRLAELEDENTMLRAHIAGQPGESHGN